MLTHQASLSLARALPPRTLYVWTRARASTHTHTHKHTLTRTFSLARSRALSLSHTHTHTNIQSHALSLSLSLPRSPKPSLSPPLSLSLTATIDLWPGGTVRRELVISVVPQSGNDAPRQRPPSRSLSKLYERQNKKKWFRGGEYMRPDSGLLPGHEMYYIHAKLCLVFQNEEFLGENLCTVDATCSAFFFVFCFWCTTVDATCSPYRPSSLHDTLAKFSTKKNQKNTKEELLEEEDACRASRPSIYLLCTFTSIYLLCTFNPSKLTPLPNPNPKQG